MARRFLQTIAKLTRMGKPETMFPPGMRLPQELLPPINRSMQELDRSFFKKTVPISALSIRDPKHINNIRTVLQRTHELLRYEDLNVPVIVTDSSDPSDPRLKVMLLAPSVKPDDSKTWSTQLGDLVVSGVAAVRPYELNLGYDAWKMTEILDAVLPEFPEDEKETPTGYAQIGHIAHVNLREQYLPYKDLIAQVLADKNPGVTTVINKTLDVGTESEFRTFPYEVLVGSNDLNVTVRHEDCVFEFDFGKVYFNPRLQYEHRRLVSKFKVGEAICDVMAGVGPFAIPAGRKKVFVRANDLNPESYKALRRCIVKNKVVPLVTASCVDGRTFIRDSTAALKLYQRVYKEDPPMTKKKVKPSLLEKLEKLLILHEPTSFDHYVMNLPATAVEFLDAFKGLYNGREQEFTPHTSRKLPMIHVHTFQRKLDTTKEEAEEVCKKVSQHLGAEIKLDDPDNDIHDVRLVSPKKKMYCASFRLPPSVAFDSGPSISSNEDVSHSYTP